jgi:hypothetical protein
MDLTKEILKMAKLKISSDDELKIKSLIQSFKKNLTWKSLIKKIEIEHGIKVTRQTLTVYQGINKSYKDMKNNLRINSENKINVTKYDLARLDKLEKLEIEIELLKKKLDGQVRMLDTIFKNAQKIPNFDIRDLLIRAHDE